MEKEEGPRIKTTKQLAALRQIHASIEHLKAGQYECAITLALAAEGQLPPSDKPHLFKQLRDHAPDLAKDGTFNLHRDWLKHWNENMRPNLEISEFAVAIPLMRAVSKFVAVYGAYLPK